MITRLGGGSFADVYKALEKSTGDIVAIKVLKKKYKKLEECEELRECRSLQILNKLPQYEKGFENIINLKKIIFTKKTGVLNLIFEYMQQDLLELMKQNEPKHLPEEKIKDIVYQTLQGLAFMHKYGFFHRDIKPENILLLNDKVKIADFGLAREIRTLPPYTEYVSTRFYRAPECILKSTNYNSPIDIWALGCVMAEMYLHPQPLFYGLNEKEVLYRICSILGTPNQDNWPEGMALAHLKDIKMPNCYKSELKDIIRDASEDAIDLMEKMIRWDPKKRETAENLLKHKFFENYFYKDFNYNINFETSGTNEYFEKHNLNINTNDINNMSINNSISISINKNIISNNISRDNKINKNNLINESTNNLISSITNNKDSENKKESDNFSGLLNDTNGFNKLLDELKKEKIQEDNDFEKQKEKNQYNNNLWLSIEKKLDINTNDNNKSVTKFINEIEEKEKNEKEKEKNDIKYNMNNARIGNDTYINKHKNEKPNSFLNELNFDNNIIKNKINNKDNNIKQNNDTFNKPIDLGLNLNNYNKNENDLDNLLNKDNNEEFNFENAKKLKPIGKNNRRGSAKKFLEENENKMKQNINMNQNINNLENNEQISVGRRRIKYNYSNNVLPKINNEKRQMLKPPLIKNEFKFNDNLDVIFNNYKKEEINNYNMFNKRNIGYGNRVTLTNNNSNLNFPIFLRDNKKDKIFEVKNNEQKVKPNFLLNKNIWDL